MSSKYTKPCQGYQEMKNTFWENDGEFISAFFFEFQTGREDMVLIKEHFWN